MKHNFYKVLNDQPNNTILNLFLSTYFNIISNTFFKVYNLAHKVYDILKLVCLQKKA